MITTVPTSRPTNKGPCVGKVPLVTGTFFFAARLPAAARIGIRNRKRPEQHGESEVRLYQGVLTLNLRTRFRCCRCRWCRRT
jgi:hypothetical protein